MEPKTETTYGWQCLKSNQLALRPQVHRMSSYKDISGWLTSSKKNTNRTKDNEWQSPRIRSARWSLSESYFVIVYKFECAVIVNLIGLFLGSDTISTDRGRTSLATHK